MVREQLPIVYVYDHCPFCVRVRLAMGVKNVKHLIHFLANDDIDTPTSLVGKKIAPIFVSVDGVWLCLYHYVCLCCCFRSLMLFVAVFAFPCPHIQLMVTFNL